MGSNVALTTGAIEEETLADYKPEQFYPVHIEEVIKSPRTNYKIIGKLGYGRYSTVWLCLDLGDNTYYTIKIGTKHNGGRREAAIYEHLEAIGSQHVGCGHVRTLHEAFDLSGPDGQHYCLVHPPMGISIEEYQDIKAQNILLALDSPSSVLNFAAAEKENPSARKVINKRRSIYTSRSLPDCFPPGHPTLCDFGHAVKGSPGAKHSGMIQPLTYRAPEVILGMAWGAEADIWNVGALMWQLAFGCHLFTGTTEEEQLAKMIACLGAPPAEFVRRCREEGKGARYFDKDGVWSGDAITPAPIDEILEGGGVEGFIDLLKGMLAWIPEERQTAAELRQHPWLRSG